MLYRIAVYVVIHRTEEDGFRRTDDGNYYHGTYYCQQYTGQYMEGCTQEKERKAYCQYS